MTASPWLKTPRPNSDARARLVCIAHAGGGAGTFRTWPDHLPEDVELVAVQLPGREERLMEEPIGDVHAIVRELAPALAAALDRPWALFGNSMGALIGFELLRALRRAGAPAPGHFFASAHRGPQIPTKDTRIHTLSDDEFVEEVDRRYAAVPAVARQDPDLMELLLPPLRADISVCDTYEYTVEPPLDCPISALGGEEDPHVSRTELEGWSEQTTAAFDLVMFAGDHFYLTSAQRELLRTLGEELGRLVP